MEDGFGTIRTVRCGKKKLIRKSLKIALNHTKKLLTHLIYIYLYYLSCAQGGEKAELKL